MWANQKKALNIYLYINWFRLMYVHTVQICNKFLIFTTTTLVCIYMHVVPLSTRTFSSKRIQILKVIEMTTTLYNRGGIFKQLFGTTTRSDVNFQSATG